jgi:general secretion pathway protein J
MNLSRHNSGFTLIEVVIALTVFAILGTMAFSGLNAILKWQTDLDDQSRQLLAVQMTMKYMERDFNQVILRSIRDQYGDTQPAFFASEENILDLTHSGWRNPAGLSRSAIQRISYQIDEEDNLVRYSWNRLDGALTEDAREVMLVEGIEEIDWQFISQQDEQLDQWPPLNADPNFTGLPAAVAVTFNVKPFGEISRIFTLPR